MLAQKCLASSLPQFRRACIRWQSSNSNVPTDNFGIPLKPTWSVNELLSSYPTPTITPATLKRLHELSALVPPEEHTQEYATLKREMEGLVKLVEAVKLADLNRGDGSVAKDGDIPDGRIWAEASGIQSLPPQVDIPGEITGAGLLQFAERTTDGLYIVDADRRK